MTRATWSVPALLAAATLSGLVVALAGDGVFDWLGWAGLSAPCLAILWAARRRAG